MAIGRISGSVLKSNLTRNGVDLAFETNLLYLDVTNSRVGIGTSEPTTALDVSGTVNATAFTGNNFNLTHGNISDGSAITSSSSITDLDTFSATSYRSAKYEISVNNLSSSKYALYTLHVVHDGTDVYVTTTGSIGDENNMPDFIGDISAGNVRVRISPSTTDTLTYKFIRTLINI